MGTRMANTEDYNVNFFKPLSDHAKANKSLISILALIWFFAVFGFHALMIIFNEPTPEKAYTEFQSVWPTVVENQDSTFEANKTFARSLLSVLGKNIAVKDDHKKILKSALTWSVISALPDSVRFVMATEPNNESIALAKSTIGLAEEGFDKIMVDLLPFSLVKAESIELSAEVKDALPGIMELYLIHNQNFFTDFTFLGFPFHYWYTAQFLLILFVVLCLIYALIIDRMNVKHKFVEEA